MKSRGKSPNTGKGKVLTKAFGPAAEEFGEELRPVGREVGAVAARATRALLKPVGGWCGASRKSKSGSLTP
jgi:hypothetical protein